MYYTKRNVQHEIDMVNASLEDYGSKIRFTCNNDDIDRDCLRIRTSDKEKSDKRRRRNRDQLLRFTQLRHTSDKVHTLRVVFELLKELHIEKK